MQSALKLCRIPISKQGDGVEAVQSQVGMPRLYEAAGRTGGFGEFGLRNPGAEVCQAMAAAGDAMPVAGSTQDFTEALG